MLMHDSIKGRYPFASVTDCFMSLFKMRQAIEEPIGEYAKMFKRAQNVLKQHVGYATLTHFVTNTKR